MENYALLSTLLSKEESVVIFIEELLLRAYEDGASDLHIEPLKESLRIRCRRDGLLREILSLSKRWHSPLVNRLKILTSSMNIAEKRLPQEGRFQMVLQKQSWDIRVASMPTLYGESMVLRLLNPAAFSQGLSALGLMSHDQVLVEELLDRPEGLVLVTGPTGSGKTTTLYTFLSRFVTQGCKVITVEDPVEYRIPGVNQVNVQEAIGMTFPLVLRSALRQATSKMMVGEIRDGITANIVIQASLTGHLIFSTLHTNDAPSALARLITMGVTPFLLATSLRGVIAQRLVRKLCSHCKEPTVLPSTLIPLLQLPLSVLAESKPMKPRGCSRCGGTGFHGRLGIFEIFLLDKVLREHLYQAASTELLRATALQQGMKTLRQDGIQKVLAGLTTLEEILHQGGLF